MEVENGSLRYKFPFMYLYIDKIYIYTYIYTVYIYSWMWPPPSNSGKSSGPSLQVVPFPTEPKTHKSHLKLGPNCPKRKGLVFQHQPSILQVQTCCYFQGGYFFQLWLRNPSVTISLRCYWPSGTSTMSRIFLIARRISLAVSRN